MTPGPFVQRLLRQAGLFHPHEPRWSAVTLWQRLKVVSAAFVALFLVAQISSLMLAGSSYTLLLASMGASAVLLFGAPQSPLARPWVFLAGHLLPAAIGLACSHLFSSFPLMSAATIAAVLFVMYLFDCMHPPGGATALVPVIATTTGQAPGLEFLWFPVGLNLAVMLCCALLLQRFLLPPAKSSVAAARPADLLPRAPQQQALLCRDIMRTDELALTPALSPRQDPQMVSVRDSDPVTVLLPFLTQQDLQQVQVLNDRLQLCGVIRPADLLAALVLQLQTQPAPVSPSALLRAG